MSATLTVLTLHQEMIALINLRRPSPHEAIAALLQTVIAGCASGHILENDIDTIFELTKNRSIAVCRQAQSGQANHPRTPHAMH